MCDEIEDNEPGNEEAFLHECVFYAEGEKVSSPVVFTIGAFIKPVKIAGGWYWMVTGFEDDTYYDGKTLDVNDYAEDFKDLVTVEEEK